MHEAVASLDGSVGFVPTMGALHAGHLALVARAREQNASVVASVFVNPLQFGAHEDFDRYPRDLDADVESLGNEGISIVFAPRANTMYPPDFSTAVDPGALAEGFEGALRPGHFRGVATVVLKLLNVIQPDALYLGQKDAQQCVVLQRVLCDLDVPVRVEIVETVREADGLALSSRNVYLTKEQRAQAPSLHASLVALRDACEKGAGKAEAIDAARRVLSPQASSDYYDIVDALTFAPLDYLHPPAFVIGAARFGATRLIDNLWVRA